ncbi:MAG: indole-3-glycerol phosphate synthase TrpC [Candidatus Marinimicrobia bacterium]|nr:indole-3-glycerol phosphate synthase TrpC [Candidatus Neomarinimicrobiota bacterium]
MNILDKIIEKKQTEIEIASKINPIEQLKETQRLFKIRDFKNSLISNDISIIAEIKFKSPSAGNLLKNILPGKISKSYEMNGASAISVLTDNHFFGGNLNFIHEVKSNCEIPVLRKDFIITEYQIWESFTFGADAILLISDALEFEKLKDLYQLSKELGLSVLLESHSKKSLDNTLKLNPEILGINCRNLKTMETDLDWFKNCIPNINHECIKIAESGIKNPNDLQLIKNLGYNGALIGTQFMKSGKPGNALAKILGRVPK